jgi:carbonic anhydrase/acetyltransferase-like protein (isoleucine patch superfamily)
MAMLIELDGVSPLIGRDVWLAPTAVLIGDVRIGERATIWFGAVLRGDLSHIVIGEETSVQDNAVLHCAERLPTIVGGRVTVGHGALLEGCVIEDEALIGMGSVVLRYARVGAGAVLAAGSVVSERRAVAPGVVAAGVPAQEKKPLSGSAADWTRTAADNPQQLRRRYLAREETPWKQPC